MKGILGETGGFCCMFRWYTVLPAAVAYVAVPVMVFLFFCRYCRASVKWPWCVLYTALSAVLLQAEYVFGLKGSGGLVLEVLLLAWCGRMAFGRKRTECLSVSVLIRSVVSVTNGIVSWVGHRIFIPFVTVNQVFIQPSDGVREILNAAAVVALLGIILRRFGRITEEIDKKTFVWLTVPVFFISMVERIIQNSIYGDNLVADSVSGKISGVVDIHHGEMLLLQIFASVCLFLTLVAHEKVTAIYRETGKLELLGQQIKAQEAYVREASMRHKQTQAFRHDIKNHLMVVEKLLREDQTGEAQAYLAQVRETAEGLFDCISTGNAAVDALLQSKLALARQEGIETECRIMIPKDGAVRDMDWCIILSNGLDNMVKACGKVEEGKRYLKLEGRRKGDFYLITMENSCSASIKDLPKDGTGLTNIRTVAGKYHGRVENEVAGGRYKLRVLLLDPQPAQQG